MKNCGAWHRSAVLSETLVEEGEETRKQQAILTEELCDQLQGYLLSKPVPAKDIPQILSEPP
jgi:EAL domain-containing protein (putative c-di-GMP-specific phosphodiesterase class I)